MGGEGRGGWGLDRNGRGLIRQVTSLVLTRKFQTDWFRITFQERLQLQLGRLLSADR